jgi:hypothetical protein
MEVVARRHWAVTEIARFVRGNAAKRLAFNKLETHLWKMRSSLAKERFEFENSELIKVRPRLGTTATRGASNCLAVLRNVRFPSDQAAKMVQRAWRNKEAKEKAAASMERARNEKVVREMKARMEHENLTKRHIFERELEAWFKEERRKVFEGGVEADLRDKKEIDRAR